MNKIIKIVDGIIHINPQELESQEIDTWAKEAQELIDLDMKDVLCLTDLTNVNIGNTAIRHKISELIKKFRPYVKKSAVIGLNNPFKKAAAQVVLTISGRKNIKIFDTKEEAINWLKDIPKDDMPKPWLKTR